MEEDRAEHQRTMEQARFQREDAKRADEDAILVQTAARILSQDLGRAQGLFKTTVKHRKWWWKGLAPSPQMTRDDRLVLARHLTRDQWAAIIEADIYVSVAVAQRGYVTDEQFVLIEDDGVLETLSQAIRAVEVAQRTLGPLAAGTPAATDQGAPGA